MKPGRITTTTLLVEEALRSVQDFLTYHDLCRATGRSINQVQAACFHLRACRVVDVIIQHGVGYWYAMPPEEDTRQYSRAETTPHTKNRKRKVRLATVVKGD